MMKMLGITFGCYLLGTALLAPLLDEAKRFLIDMLISLPAMMLVAAHFAIASARYARGDFDALWQRVKRDRAI
jgi:hypothetical protein